MSLAAVSKHVGVLDEANLLIRTREGRLHWRRFNPAALEAARASIDGFMWVIMTRRAPRSLSRLFRTDQFM